MDDITDHAFEEDPLQPDRCSVCGLKQKYHVYPEDSPLAFTKGRRDPDLAESLLDRVRDEMLYEQDAKWGWPRPDSFLEDDRPNTGEQDSDVEAWTLWSLFRRIEARSRELLGSNKASWQAILSEEIGEAYAVSEPTLRVAELIQVAAVALSHAQAIEEHRSPVHIPDDIRDSVAAHHPDKEILRFIPGDSIDLTEQDPASSFVACPELDGWLELVKP